jgi:hypothetical protein
MSIGGGWRSWRKGKSRPGIQQEIGRRKSLEDAGEMPDTVEEV